MRHSSLFIDGAWISAADPEHHRVVGAATEETLYLVPEATSSEIDHAVDAARAALDGWRSTSAQSRSELLLSMRDGVLERLDEIAEIWATEAGMPISAGRALRGGFRYRPWSPLPRSLVPSNTSKALGTPGCSTSRGGSLS